MTLPPRLRKLAFTAHVTVSVGWLGAVVAYLALAIAGLTRQDAQLVRAAYLAMELIGWCVIVPCSLAALLSGLVQSLGTEWGLFRHYWLLVKFLLTLGGALVLLVHMRTVSRMSGLAAETTLSGADFAMLRTQLVVHAVGGLLVLLAATVLSVYKPWGKTRYGQRQQLERRQVSQPLPPRSGLYVLLGAMGLLLLLVFLHLVGGRLHHP
ncbi:hypothetical protein [Archangium sp.]|jgi:hypothetical protein|uniref:hypothetical protein n=1 Tax=Archangium sp. TaxID=1872627 RepID=UPI002ED9443B